METVTLILPQWIVWLILVLCVLSIIEHAADICLRHLDRKLARLKKRESKTNRSKP